MPKLIEALRNRHLERARKLANYHKAFSLAVQRDAWFRTRDEIYKSDASTSLTIAAARATELLGYAPESEKTIEDLWKDSISPFD